ncbi:hypothetical protein ACSYAY_06650 [Leptospirillum ferriphilum]|uniref:hypothetical protein n=1 Tax=Leptospirillum ferriphilum TaxID=178606 RepID=UPI003EE4DE2E
MGDVIAVGESSALRLIEEGLATDIPSCKDCTHFSPDDINPGSGGGDCSRFFLPDGRRNIVRWPSQQPKTDDCFQERRDA